MNESEHLVASWRKSPRGIYRDDNAERLDLRLAGRLRLVDTDDSAEALLYLDLDSGRYLELRFQDWPDGQGGSASLAPLSVGDVTERYRREPDVSVEESVFRD